MGFKVVTLNHEFSWIQKSSHEAAFDITSLAEGQSSNFQSLQNFSNTSSFLLWHWNNISRKEMTYCSCGYHTSGMTPILWSSSKPKWLQNEQAGGLVRNSAFSFSSFVYSLVSFL